MPEIVVLKIFYFSISLCWNIKPPLDQETPLPLMLENAVLWYIYSWSHGTFHVYSLVGGLVCGNSGGLGGDLGVLVGSYCSFSYGAASSFSSFSPFSNSSIGDPVLSPMVGCEHPPLYLLGTGRASQETPISGSCQQALLGIHNSVRVL